MPRRKITIEEAFTTLHEAGIPVQVKPAVPTNYVEEPVEEVPVRTGRRKGQIFDTSPKLPKPVTTVKVTLWAKHSVGSGGTLVVGEDGTKYVTSAGVESYGPGICIVPIGLADHLLHADAAAKQADQRFLDPVMHSYLAVPRQIGSMRANVGVEVNGSLFGGDFTNLSDDNMHIIG